MERQNFSFPDETRQQLVALANNVERYGGNQSEVVRAAIVLHFRYHFRPESIASDAVLERVYTHIKAAVTTIESEFARRAELRDEDI